MTLKKRHMQQRQKAIFVNKDHEEAIQLHMDYDGEP